MTKYKQPGIKIFRGKKSGPSLLVFGAIHGDETCGTFAIKKIIKEIEFGHIAIEKGVVVFVPICNPLAYKKRKRFIEENLNRVFKTWKKPNSYEKKLANYLTKLIRSCDIFLDIHSVSTKSVPLVFIDFSNKETLSFARILGASYGLKGWPKLYQNNRQNIKSYDTTCYANRLHKKCLTVECGQHGDSRSKNFAHSAIINTLRYFGFIEGKVRAKKMREIRLKKLFLRKNKKDIFCRSWKNFDKFKKGDILAKKETRGKIIAPFDGIMILPKSNAEIGTEWFYIGVTD